MSKQPSRHVVKVAGESAARLAGLIATSTRRNAQVILFGAKYGCELMAEAFFSIERCKLYSRSGSSSCVECHYHYDLEKVADPIGAYIKRARGPLQAYMRKEEIMASAHGVCTKCERERTLVSQLKQVEGVNGKQWAGLCHGCGYGGDKDLSKEEVLYNIANGITRKRGPKGSGKKASGDVKTSGGLKAPPGLLREHDATRPVPKTAPFPAPAPPLSERTVPDPRPKGNAKDITLVFRSHEDNAIFAHIAEMAKKHRRAAEEEILIILERAVGIDMGEKEIPSLQQIRKTITKLRSYPVPNGSTKEVFAAAFDIVDARLAEMQE